MTANVATKKEGISEVEEAKRAWLNVQKEVQNLDHKLDTIEEKKQKRRLQLDEAKGVFSDAAEEKRIALSALALDEITEGEFETLRNNHDRAGQSIDDILQMLKVLDEEVGEVGNQRKELALKARELEQNFWGCVERELRLQAESLSPVLYKSFLAYRLSRPTILGLGEYLEEVVFSDLKNPVNNPKVDKLKGELIQQYVGKAEVR